MCVQDLIDKGFAVVSGGDDASAQITGIYCCDLLSLVMGRAKQGDAWITVMNNINTIAVAALADVACVVMSEGIEPDPPVAKKAEEEGIWVLKTELPTYEAAILIKSIFE